MSAAVAGGAAGAAAAARRRRMMQMIGANGLNTANAAIFAAAEKIGRKRFDYELMKDGEYRLKVTERKLVAVEKFFGGTKEVERDVVRLISFGEVIDFLPENAVIIGVIDNWMADEPNMRVVYAILPKDTEPK